MSSSKSWTGTLESLRQASELAMVKDGIAPVDARRLADDVVLSISRQMGGNTVYIPRAHSVRCAMRQRAIYQAFTGNNIAELADKFRMTKQGIYLAIRSQRSAFKKVL